MHIDTNAWTDTQTDPDGYTAKHTIRHIDKHKCRPTDNITDRRGNKIVAVVRFHLF